MAERKDEMGRMKKRVLLSFVGERDPFARDTKGGETITDGSILSLCDHEEIDPDIVYLFPSSKTGNPKRNTEDNARKVEQELKKRHPDLVCKILPLDVDDATDFDQISKELARNINKVLNKLGDISDHQFNLNCSSGTQQMTAVGHVLASTGRIPGIVRWQCKDPKDVKPGEERIKAIGASFLEEGALLKRIDANVEGYHFHSIIDDCATLEGLTNIPERQSITKIVKYAFMAYEKMSFMQYKDAYDKISSVRSTIQALSLPSLSAVLDAQEAFLKKVKGQREDESAHNLVDLYFNMERAFTRGDHVDVLARFWRLREGMLYYRLLKRYGIEKRKLLQSPDQENLKKLMTDRKYSQDIDQNRGSFYQENLDWFTRMPIAVFGDRELADFNSRSSGALDRLRVVRNKTIVAHGMRPVEKADVEACMSLGKEIIKLIPGGQEVYDEYPFTLENMRALVGLLKKV